MEIQTINRFQRLIQFTDFLDLKKIQYCIVGDTSDYPVCNSDIDIIVDPKSLSSLHQIISKFCKEYDVQLVQVLQHEQNAYYYVLAWFDQNEVRFLHPDICGDYYRKGILFLEARELLLNRIKAKDESGNNMGFYVASPAHEFIYYLLKKIDKQRLDDKQGLHLYKEWHKDKSGALKQIQRFWDKDDVNQIAESAETNNWQIVRENLAQLQRSIHRKLVFSVKSYWREFKRKVYRVLEPTGAWVAFLGADGSGKSTVIKSVQEQLAPVFRKTAYYHLRPYFLSLKSHDIAVVTNPHASEKRGLIASIAKLILFWLDYTSGYFADIRWRKVYSTFVLFDRYYHDLLVDTKRYRYGAPLWIAEIIAKLIPMPDILILLDAPPDVLQARKQEVSYEESSRQQKEYLKIMRSIKNAAIVDGSQPSEDVVRNVNKIILSYMADRTKNRITK